MFKRAGHESYIMDICAWKKRLPQKCTKELLDFIQEFEISIAADCEALLSDLEDRTFEVNNPAAVDICQALEANSANYEPCKSVASGWRAKLENWKNEMPSESVFECFHPLVPGVASRCKAHRTYLIETTAGMMSVCAFIYSPDPLQCTTLAANVKFVRPAVNEKEDGGFVALKMALKHFVCNARDKALKRLCQSNQIIRYVDCCLSFEIEAAVDAGLGKYIVGDLTELPLPLAKAATAYAEHVAPLRTDDSAMVLDVGEGESGNCFVQVHPGVLAFLLKIHPLLCALAELPGSGTDLHHPSEYVSTSHAAFHAELKKATAACDFPHDREVHALLSAVKQAATDCIGRVIQTASEDAAVHVETCFIAAHGVAQLAADPDSIIADASKTTLREWLESPAGPRFIAAYEMAGDEVASLPSLADIVVVVYRCPRPEFAAFQKYIDCERVFEFLTLCTVETRELEEHESRSQLMSDCIRHCTKSHPNVLVAFQP